MSEPTQSFQPALAITARTPVDKMDQAVENRKIR